MKTTIVLASAILLLCAQYIAAETAEERDFKALKANRAKAAAVALDPINRRYKDELEKLFKKATQNAQLDLARDIQGELQLLGGADLAKTAGGAPATTTSSSNSLAEKADLKKFIQNSEWQAWTNLTMKGEAPGKVLFQKDGRTTKSGEVKGWGYFYSVEAPDILKVFQDDPKKQPKQKFMLLHINLDDKTAVKDASLSSDGWGDKSLKYMGPAKIK